MATFSEDFFQNKDKEEIVKQISELRRNIKKKHRSLKREMLDSEEQWEKQFAPIAEPLKKLVEEGNQKIKQQQQQQKMEESAEEIKQERKRKVTSEEEGTPPVKRYSHHPQQGQKRKQKVNIPTRLDFESDYEYDYGNLDLPVAKRRPESPVEHMEDEGEDADDEENMQVESIAPPVLQRVTEEVVYSSPSSGQELLKTPEGRNLAKRFIEREFKGRLSKEYFLKLIGGGKNIDHNYGVRVEGNNWMIGDKALEIDKDDLIIDGKSYRGTRGLYELLFMNVPNEYTYEEEDLENYRQILEVTNVHRVNYSALGKVRSNRGKKYKNIISRLMASASTRNQGEGDNDMMLTLADVARGEKMGHGLFLTDAPMNVIYWNDPNELVDRLRTLMASQEAGNTAHANEINSIIEELVELDKSITKTDGQGIVD